MAMSPARHALQALSFNQDHSCIAVGTRTGYAIANCEPFSHIFSQSALTLTDDGPVARVEMLFSTSLVAVVPLADGPLGASPRTLHIINTKVCLCPLIPAAIDYLCVALPHEGAGRTHEQAAPCRRC